MKARRPARARERGVALLATLLAVALLTVIVVELTDATLVHTHLTRNAGNAMAAQLLARSAETAGEALVTNDTTNDPDVTCPDDEWATPIVGLPVGPGVVALEISDEGGKLDLNSVATERYRAAAAELFETLGLEPELVDRVAAWIRPATSDPMATDQASDYCALPMPCEPRQGALNSLEELLLIEGFDESTLRRLRPFVTVVKRDGSGSAATRAEKVNLNTAREELLVALGCQTGAAASRPPCSSTMTEEDLTAWRAEVQAWLTDSCDGVPRDTFVTSSKLFAIRAVGTVGDLSQTLRVLVRRDGARARRLWWQERPVSEVLPVEVG
jgi:general secretion pathway protein K